MPSGKLPGIYKIHLLVRPYPSLRILFGPKAARKMGQLQQRPLLAHVAAPASTLSGLKGSFQSWTPVTAKIAMMKERGNIRDGTATRKWGKKGDNPEKYGQVCWISATPMLDSNDKVGV